MVIRYLNTSLLTRSYKTLIHPHLIAYEVLSRMICRGVRLKRLLLTPGRKTKRKCHPNC